MGVPLKAVLPVVMVLLVLTSGLTTGLIAYYMTSPVVQTLVDDLDFTNLRGIRPRLREFL
jgi:hypothetical protein